MKSDSQDKIFDVQYWQPTSINSMYAQGMTTGRIQDHLKEIYGVDKVAGFFRTVTDAGLGDY